VRNSGGCGIDGVDVDMAFWDDVMELWMMSLIDEFQKYCRFSCKSEVLV
jgi:hypothetical protein